MEDSSNFGIFGFVLKELLLIGETDFPELASARGRWNHGARMRIDRKAVDSIGTRAAKHSGCFKAFVDDERDIELKRLELQKIHAVMLMVHQNHSLYFTHCRS